MQTPGQLKFNSFREKFPFLSYEGFYSKVQVDGILVEYHFNLSDTHIFRPKFHFPVKSNLKKKLDEKFITSSLFQNLLFHIGMIELISYWKAACPEVIKVKGVSLDKGQVKWWKNVYYQGLGEFFFTNGIKVSMEDFLTIESEGKNHESSGIELSDCILVPIGGGKDSVVTLELLRNDYEVRPFILNPRGASVETCNKAGFSNLQIAEVNRSIDPLLLKLNSEGFLNGHTPFSALLAFYTLLVASIYGCRHIALSNESSANEPTVAGTEVNHQYSKSYSFEKDFREYVAKYISADFNYFSFLRPLSELQIAMLFSRQVRYYPVFKSCNVGSKTDVWCGHCPKCLFAWIILSPFIPLNELIQIFGKNLYEDAGMIGYLKELTGMDAVKPFECVGTIEEVNAALQMFIQEHAKEKWPLLIDYYSNTSNFNQYHPVQSYQLLHEINGQHFLGQRFLDIIKSAIS
ncbi:MAG: hypothetical protein HXX13_00830 [Bacteroidetes bacterium]|nr:hypothetical protein [Bacteroidota bacterium]